MSAQASQSTPLEEMQSELKALVKSVGKKDWTQLKVSTNGDQTAKTESTGMRGALLVADGADGTRHGAVLIDQGSKYRMHWTFPGVFEFNPLKDYQGKDALQVEIRPIGSLASELIAPMEFPAPGMQFNDQGKAERFPYNEQYLMIALPDQSILDVRFEAIIEAMVCPKEGVSAEQPCIRKIEGILNGKVAKPALFQNVWDTLRSSLPGDKSIVSVINQGKPLPTGKAGSAHPFQVSIGPGPEAHPGATSFFYPLQTLEVYPHGVSEPRADDGQSIKQMFVRQGELSKGTFGVLRIINADGTAKSYLAKGTAAALSKAVEVTQSAGNNDLYLYAGLTFFLGICVVLMIRCFWEVESDELKSSGTESQQPAQGVKDSSRRRTVKATYPDGRTEWSDGTITQAPTQGISPGQNHHGSSGGGASQSAFGDAPVPDGSWVGGTVPKGTVPPEVQTPTTDSGPPKSADEPMPLSSEQPKPQTAGNLAQVRPLVEGRDQNQRAPTASVGTAGRDASIDADTIVPEEPAAPARRSVPSAPGPQTLTPAQKEYISDIRSTQAGGPAAALLAELVYKYGPSWAHGFKGQGDKAAFLAWLNDDLFHVVNNYRDEADTPSTLNDNWVEPELVPSLDKLGHFASLLAADAFHGHGGAEEPLDDMYDFLFDSVSDACADAGWFTIERVEPFRTQFDAGRHRGGAPSEPVPGASGLIIRILRIGRIQLDGTPASQTTVVAGL